jgi:hypothetical protein
VSRYYYFASTLQTPQLGVPAPMTSEEFLDRCGRHLGPEDLKAVEAAVLVSAPAGPPAATAGSPLLVRYYAWERTLRNELVRLRARKLDRPADPWLRTAGRDDVAARVAPGVFGAGSPLEAEMLVERFRWEAIEALKVLHFFDFDSIAAYRLELQILERLARFRPEQGEARYRDTYAAILGAAQPALGVEQ